MKRGILIALWLLLIIGTGPATASTYDFEYSYGDPYLAASQQYITSTTNAVLHDEGSYKFWKPGVGSSTEASTTPGLVTYHFNFADQIAQAYLSIAMHTFNWSYSDGHDFLYASTDGASWQQLMEVETPVYGGYTYGGYNAILPSSVVGLNDIWLQARLYSFGPSASSGGVFTNTAQLSRYDTSRQNATFNIGVDFVDEGTSSVPEPATMILFGLGLLGLAGISRKTRQ